MIRLSAKGLAKYMTSGHATQRKILSNYKNPDPEGAAQAKYYAEARHAIAQYHTSGNNAAVAVHAVQTLHSKELRSTGRSQDRVRNNIRALESYLNSFAEKYFVVLPSPDLRYTKGQVSVTAFPDLYVRDGQRHKIVKLDLGKDEPSARAINIVLQVTFAAAQSAGLPITPKDVVYLDVERGREHRGARVRSQLMRDIEAACQTIEAVWPGI